MLTPLPMLALEMEEMYALGGRQVSPFIISYHDSLIDIDYGIYGLGFTYADTLGQVGRSFFVEPTPEIDDNLVACVPLGDGWFEMVIGRSTGPGGDYWWPCLYRFHVADTGFVDGRFREIELPSYCKVVFATTVPGGGYVLLYTDRDERNWHRVARITEDGEVLWTESIIENPAYRGSTGFSGIIPSSSDPSQYYIFSRLGPSYAHISLIDTSGAVLWMKQHRWGGSFNLSSMVSFSDGTYGLIGSGNNNIEYLHLNAEAENIGLHRFFTGETVSWYYLKTLLIDGERMLILTEFDSEVGRNLHLGLLYVNKEGDSLDCHHFHPDTVTTGWPGPMIERPDGKVMLWVYGFYWDRRNRQINSDLLYTFYPDGGPRGVEEDKRDAYPTGFSLSAFPNPFNSSTTITFSTDGTPPPTPPAIAGGDRRTVVWDALDQPAGVYLVRLQSGGEVATRKIVLLR